MRMRDDTWETVGALRTRHTGWPPFARTCLSPMLGVAPSVMNDGDKCSPEKMIHVAPLLRSRLGVPPWGRSSSGTMAGHSPYEASDAFLAILTNRKVAEDKVGPNRDLLAEFPYLGSPPSGVRVSGAMEMRLKGGLPTQSPSSR
jgi:hypothetical protein